MIWFLSAMVLLLMVCLWGGIKRVEELEKLNTNLISQNSRLSADYEQLHGEYKIVSGLLQTYVDDEDDDEDFDDWQDEQAAWDERYDDDD